MQQFFTIARAGIIIALVMQHSIHANNGSFLRSIFGSQKPSAVVQKLSQQADDVSGFTTPVYQMNACGKLFGYSSFNWFNTTWIDEEGLENRSEKSIIWQLLHEKYHTLAAHDWRRILGAGMLAADVLSTSFWSMNSKVNHGMAFVADRAFWSCLALFLFLWHEEYCEHAADEYADRIMNE